MHVCEVVSCTQKCSSYKTTRKWDCAKTSDAFLPSYRLTLVWIQIQLRAKLPHGEGSRRRRPLRYGQVHGIPRGGGEGEPRRRRRSTVVVRRGRRGQRGHRPGVPPRPRPARDGLSRGADPVGEPEADFRVGRQVGLPRGQHPRGPRQPRRTGFRGRRGHAGARTRGSLPPAKEPEGDARSVGLDGRRG